MSIFWIDGDGYLIPRAVLRAGDRHSELLSHTHLWCITATSVIRHNGYRKDDNSNWANMGHFAGKKAVEVGYYVDTEQDVIGKTSISVLLRPIEPNLSSLTQSTVTATWIPWTSLSIAEYSKPSSTNKTIQNPDEYPGMSFQIFDAFKKT